MESILFISALVIVFVSVQVVELFSRRDATRATEAREKKYLAMISDLQNRLTAKDLQGYQVLRQVQERDDSPSFSVPFNDEELAKIEEAKRSLAARSLAGQI